MLQRHSPLSSCPPLPLPCQYCPITPAHTSHSPPQSLEKAETAAAARAGGERVAEGGPVMKSQKDITLAKDLEVRDR